MKAHLQNILARYDNKRLLTIDVFRGITITAMILVNNPGSWSYVYAPLRHAEWHGWTPTDLIFPFFIFLVGWSIYASKAAQAQFAQPSSGIVKAAVRSLKLFALGLFLALFFYNFRDPNFSWLNERLADIRIMGVLQRIAVVYFLTYLIVAHCRLASQGLIAISLILIYVIGVYFLPYADVNGLPYQGNLALGFTFIDYLDTHIIGRNHLYQGALQPFASDPEGLFSTIPAIVSCLSGAWLAMWMHKRPISLSYCLRLVATGAILAAAGMHLDSLIPINKPMWTPSYVLLSSGFAILSVGCLSYLLDLKKWRMWSAPFIVFGINSIAFFMFAGVFGRLLLMVSVGNLSLKQWLFANALAPIWGNFLGSLVFALLFLVLSYALMYAMYRRDIIWKV